MEPTRRDIDRPPQQPGDVPDKEAAGDAPRGPSASAQTSVDVPSSAPTSVNPPDDYEISAELDPTAAIDSGSMPEHVANPQRLQTVGPYEVESILGAGGMGTVYLARHKDTGDRAAVKVLPAAMAREGGFVARFTREIEALQSVDNPYIVRLLGHGVDPQADGSAVHFYVMEYVDGETVTQKLRREHRFDWREVVRLGAQICSALKAAHNAGIIHRDLKPSNLLLTTPGGDGRSDVKLTDFGVAQVFASSKLTVTGGIIGTAEYMSPEQAEGRRVTKQSDIYSLGAVLYAMLTGRPPFVGTGPIDLAQKHRAGIFDAPRRYAPETPQWLDEVICRCLEKKPEDRYPDAYVLQRRLEEIPRKVELALSESSQTGGHTALTVDSSARQQELGGTFVAGMMRAELEREARGGPGRQLLDNTWVLLTLLAGVVAFAVWMARGTSASPEELLARGEALMQSGDLDDWQRARREAFEPLLDADPSYENRVRPYLERLEIAELARPGRRRGLARAAGSEPHRLLRLAAAQLESGDVDTAARTAAALAALLVGDEGHAEVRAAAERLSDEIDSATAATDRAAFVNSRRELAERLREEGRGEAAEAVERALQTLYGG